MFAFIKRALMVLAVLYLGLCIVCWPRTTTRALYTTELDGTRLELIEVYTNYPGVRATVEFHARLTGPQGSWDAPMPLNRMIPWPGPDRWGRRLALRRPEGRDYSNVWRVLYLDPARVSAEQFEAWASHLGRELPAIDAAFDVPRDGQTDPYSFRKLRLVGLHRLDWDSLARRYDCGDRRWLGLKEDGTIGAYQGQPLGDSASFTRLGQVLGDGRTARLTRVPLSISVEIDWPGALERCRHDGHLLGEDFQVELVADDFPRVPERDWETGRELAPTGRAEPQVPRRRRRTRGSD